jgi:Ca2+/Na+ antiporter
MNKTQKGALCTLIASLFLILFGILLFSEIVILKSFFTSLHRFIALILVCLFVPYLIFLLKKQSPTEVESDERDNLIIKRAILVSFVSVWIMLAGVCIIPRFIVGETGAIPVYVLTFINVGIFVIAMLVYNVAILIQYGRTGKGEKS